MTWLATLFLDPSPDYLVGDKVRGGGLLLSQLSLRTKTPTAPLHSLCMQTKPVQKDIQCNNIVVLVLYRQVCLISPSLLTKRTRSLIILVNKSSTQSARCCKMFTFCLQSANCFIILSWIFFRSCFPPGLSCLDCEDRRHFDRRSNMPTAFKLQLLSLGESPLEILECWQTLWNLNEVNAFGTVSAQCRISMCLFSFQNVCQHLISVLSIWKS